VAPETRATIREKISLSNTMHSKHSSLSQAGGKEMAGKGGLVLNREQKRSRINTRIAKAKRGETNIVPEING